MEATTQPPADTADREVVIERVLNAPRDLVFRAWADVKHREKWWGPNGFHSETIESDFRVGGQWRHTMIGPDGKKYPNRANYVRIVEPELIEYDNGWDVEHFVPMFRATITFEALGFTQTKVTMRCVFPTAEERDERVRLVNAIEGGNQTLDRMVAHVATMTPVRKHRLEVTLPDDRSIKAVRRFDAPRALLWEVMTNPAHMRKWWGCGLARVTVCEFEPRVGGRYAIDMTMPDGSRCPLKGEVLEIAPPERLVHTQIYDIEPYDKHVATITITLTEKDGVTTLEELIVHDCKEARDGHFQSGLEVGMTESMNRIEDLAASL